MAESFFSSRRIDVHDPSAGEADRLARIERPPGVRASVADESGELARAATSSDYAGAFATPPTYNQDAADEAAAALLWLTASHEPAQEGAEASPMLPAEILRRLERRGWLSSPVSSVHVHLTAEGEQRCHALFESLFGAAKPASLPPRREPHVVQEEDGE